MLFSRIEGLAVHLGRVAALTAGQIEGDDAASLVGDRELGEAVAVPRVHVADAAEDHAGGDAEVPLGPAKAVQDGIVDAGERQAPAGMEHRRIAHLEMPDVFVGGVFGEFVGGALEGFLGLHDRAGDVEGLQVFDEVLADLALVDRLREAVFGVGRQLHLLAVGEVEDRRQTQAAVEVTVEVRFRQGLEQLAGHPGAAALGGCRHDRSSHRRRRRASSRPRQVGCRREPACFAGPGW
jgi:hypothetical protein